MQLLKFTAFHAPARAGWSPGFDLNIEQTFETKRQQVHSLQEGLPFGEVGALSQCLWLPAAACSTAP